jgi:hypothetical protein
MMPDILRASGEGIAWGRAGTFVVAAALGSAGGYFGQPWIHNNDRAINVVVVSFSILAGFLVAIMTIVGDPTIFGRRSWRVHEHARVAIYRQLMRQRWLFMLYLTTLSAIFIESLIPTSWCAVSRWIERIYLGLAIGAFVISFRLPGTLMRIQMARHDVAIDSRRHAAGNRGDSEEHNRQDP